eukprot:6181068-Pleurochrysis_carterae.AAC.1
MSGSMWNTSASLCTSLVQIRLLWRAGEPRQCAHAPHTHKHAEELREVLQGDLRVFRRKAPNILRLATHAHQRSISPYAIHLPADRRLRPPAYLSAGTQTRTRPIFCDAFKQQHRLVAESRSKRRLTEQTEHSVMSQIFARCQARLFLLNHCSEVFAETSKSDMYIQGPLAESRMKAARS